MSASIERSGRTLHDSVCQSLAAIDFAIGLLKKRLEPKTKEDAQSAEEIQQMLRKTLVETRSLARGIFPVQLEKDGLAVALEELVASTRIVSPGDDQPGDRRGDQRSPILRWRCICIASRRRR